CSWRTRTPCSTATASATEPAWARPRTPGRAGPGTGRRSALPVVAAPGMLADVVRAGIAAQSVRGDAAEQAVEEPRRLVGGVLLGQRHRLADRHGVVDVVPVQHLVDPDPGDVAVHH